MLESFLLHFLAFFGLLSSKHIIELLIDLLTLGLHRIDHIELAFELDSNLSKLRFHNFLALLLSLESVAAGDVF